MQRAFLVIGSAPFRGENPAVGYWKALSERTSLWLFREFLDHDAGLFVPVLHRR